MFEALAPFSAISPAWPFILAGLLCFALPWHGARKALMLLAPTLALALWFAPAEPGVYGVINLGPFQLETYRYDGLSRVWGLVFILVGFINAIYALHERARISDGSALIYGGAALGAVFAGDFLTLFLFWEITAIASAPLIFAAGTAAAYRAGLRYLAIQVLSGVLLLAGAVLWVRQTGDWTFGEIGLGTPAGFIILVAFGIKAAFPLMHNWLQDAYPKASVTGTVVLSAFTTKMAIYALARGYAGEDILIWIGAVMAAFPIFFAIVENDLRRVLSYSLNNQLGFMIVGIGVGTELGLAGAAANAFVHVIYKALLFMSMGAVLHRLGSVKATDLGGLYKSMPMTAVFCLIGAMSLSAVPLFSGFVAKSLILSAALADGHFLPFLILVFASAGVLEHSGIKVPYFAFFGKDSGKRPQEAPWNMLLAMGLLSFLCVYLGVNYGALYALLPYQIEYAPYTFDNIVGQMQLLIAALFAFSLLVRLRLYPLQTDITVLDTDWVYRRFLDGAARWGSAMVERLIVFIQIVSAGAGRRFGRRLFNLFSPAGVLSRELPSGLMALWTALMLTMVLVVAFFVSV